MTQAFCGGFGILVTKQSVKVKMRYFKLKIENVTARSNLFFSPWNFGVLNITKILLLVNPGTLTTPQRKNANLKNK